MTVTTSPATSGRWRPDRRADRHSLAIAVRRVGTAQGRDQTVQRLRELAAEAHAWADALSANSYELRR
jgi:hypothetical protein